MSEFNLDYVSGLEDKAKRSAAPLATIGDRFLAALIDGLIVTGISFVIGMVIGFVAVIVMAPQTEADITQMQATLQPFSQLVGFILSLIYYVYIPVRWDGRTVGKNVMKIRIIRSNGDSVGYGTMFLREIIGKFLSAIIFFIGYIMAFFDDENRTLHDRLADTRVVKQ